MSVYDLEEKREIPIKFPDTIGQRFYIGYVNDNLYFRQGAEDDELCVARINFSELLQNNNLQATIVIGPEDVGYTNITQISPNGRYFATCGNDEDFILIYDFEQNKWIVRMAQPDGHDFWILRFMDNHTLYIYNEHSTLALEITLP